MSKLLLITSPLTQLNTPYPATAYLKGFLQQFNYSVSQADLGIELVLKIFSTEGLQKIFDAADSVQQLSENAQRILALQNEYLQTIETVVNFLQGKNEMLAHRICSLEFLPQAKRFEQANDLEWAFGTMGIRDQARFLATLYIEDIGDFIREAVSPFFAFTRYAEQIARTAISFDPIQKALENPIDLVDSFMIEILDTHIENEQPEVIGFSVPFSGNLYGALRCGKYIKEKYPHIKLIMGGGYPNTELRDLKDIRLFNYIDYLTLDDGEAPVLQLLKYFDKKIEEEELKRTFYKKDNELCYTDSSNISDFEHSDVGTPDYTGLPLDQYLSVIEMANPMHRLWSDGRWNKLTLAHGCYWHRCTFCDISLDYIKRYSATSASQIVDRIEAVIKQTGEMGFHFTDEAAPPALLRDLALELLQRRLNITWWTNIRFEKSFTQDLVRLLAASGCIAVSGGLEVASDRLLKLIKKGTNIKQVSKVTHNFAQAGIMVHAYLMYGFPTQTEQETIDALEVVRQLFEQGVLQSAFWHKFTMTVHSPVGLAPNDFKVVNTGPGQGSFANNDLFHDDPHGANHELFGEGLNKSVYNFMHELGFDEPLQGWFEFPVPKISIPNNLVQSYIENETSHSDVDKTHHHVVWTGTNPIIEYHHKKKNKCNLIFFFKKGEKRIKTSTETAEWIQSIINKTNTKNKKFLKLQEVSEDFTEKTGLDFMPFILSKEWQNLRVAGLLIVR